MLRSLLFMHSHLLVHTDLKLENLLFVASDINDRKHQPLFDRNAHDKRKRI